MPHQIAERFDESQFVFFCFEIVDAVIIATPTQFQVQLPPRPVVQTQVIPIRQELPRAGLALSAAALPKIDGYEFELLPGATAQAEADRTRKNVPFIAIDRASITGDEATVWIGADLAMPADPATVKMCCCEAEGQFERRQGRWSFVKWRTTKCS